MRSQSIGIFRESFSRLAIINNDKFRITQLDIADCLGTRDYRLCLCLYDCQILSSIFSYTFQEIIEPMFIFP
jgi:hypothetical protein